MGIVGLNRWLENQGVQTVCTKRTERADIVIFDMNALLHLAYDRPSSSTSATLSNLMTLVGKLLDFFPPRETVAFVFDGVAPLSKLACQRERRRKYALLDEFGPTGRGKPKDLSKIELSEAHITTGGSFILQAEEAVRQYVAKNPLFAASAEKKKEVLFSSCLEPGEGELKISALIRRWITTEEEEHRRGGHAQMLNKNVFIVGNDSDLLLTCLACTPMHNFFLVHPQSLIVTSVGDLLLSWTKHGHNRLTVAQLPSARVDFVFLQLLAGSDHFPGVGVDSAMSMWYRYKSKRATPGRRDARLVVPHKDGRLRVNGNFLQEIVTAVTKPPPGARKKDQFDPRKVSQRSVEEGQNLLRGCLWQLSSALAGFCVDPGYVFRGDAPKLFSLRAAVSRSLATVTATQAQSLDPPLRPLESFVAVMARAQFMPRAVQEELTVNKDRFGKLTSLNSTATIVKTVKDVFLGIERGKFSEIEQRLLPPAVAEDVAVAEHVDPHQQVREEESDKAKARHEREASLNLKVAVALDPFISFSYAAHGFASIGIMDAFSDKVAQIDTERKVAAKKKEDAETDEGEEAEEKEEANESADDAA